VPPDDATAGVAAGADTVAAGADMVAFSPRRAFPGRRG